MKPVHYTVMDQNENTINSFKLSSLTLELGDDDELIKIKAFEKQIYQVFKKNEIIIIETESEDDKDEFKPMGNIRKINW